MGHRHSNNYIFSLASHQERANAHFFTLSGCWAMKDFHDLVPLPVKGLLRS